MSVTFLEKPDTEKEVKAILRTAVVEAKNGSRISGLPAPKQLFFKR